MGIRQTSKTTKNPLAQDRSFYYPLSVGKVVECFKRSMEDTHYDGLSRQALEDRRGLRTHPQGVVSHDLWCRGLDVPLRVITN